MEHRQDVLETVDIEATADALLALHRSRSAVLNNELHETNVVKGREEKEEEEAVATAAPSGDADNVRNEAAIKPVSKASGLAAGQVNRVVAQVVPEGMHVSRDAKAAFQKAATISLLYLACLAEEERTLAKSKRTTLSPQDVRDAMTAAGMAHLVPLLQTPVKRER